MLIFPTEDLNPNKQRPYVAWAIMVGMVGAFGWTAWQSDPAAILARFSFNPAHPTMAGALGAMFLHADLAHLLINLVFLAIVADNVEDSMGHLGFAGFFLLSGLAAEWAHPLGGLADPTRGPVLASSGSVTAVIGAYALLFPWSQIRFKGFLWLIWQVRPLEFTVSSLWTVPFWFALQGLLYHLGVGEGGLSLPGMTGGLAAGAALTGLAMALGRLEMQPRAAAEVPAAVGPTEDPRTPCPGCLEAMNQADVFGVVVDLCPACGGLWLDRGELDQLVRSSGLPTALLDPPAASPDHLVLHEGERACPRCVGPFELRDFRGTVVEYCRACGGMWLEKGELGALLGTLGKAPIRPGPPDS